MEEVGIDIAGETAQGPRRRGRLASDVIITMGCGDACPVYPGKRYLDWDLPDPAGQGVERCVRSATRSESASPRCWRTARLEISIRLEGR